MQVEITVQCSATESYTCESCNTDAAVRGVVALVNMGLGRYSEGTDMVIGDLDALLEFCDSCEWVVTVRYGNPFVA